VGAGILLAFLAIGGIIIVVTLVRENLELQTTDHATATAEFERVRAQFPDRMPLLEVTEDGQTRYVDANRVVAGAGTVDALHLLAWDPDEGQLARISLPFWLLRLKSGPIEFGAYASGVDDNGVNLSPEEIEKYGPGILLDHKTSSGERVLFWAQ